MNSIFIKIRRGEGPFWSWLKTLAMRMLRFHLPTRGGLRTLWKTLYGFHVFVRETWIWVCRFFWYDPLFRSQCTSIGNGLQIEKLPYIQGRGRIEIGEWVRLSGKPAIAFNNRYDECPKLRIGDHTFIGHQTSFRVARGIQIGNHCLIAGAVSISDFDGHPLDASSRRNNTSPVTDIFPVEIGDDVWIGSGASILKGVTIGDRAIVGARSVVTKDVPADTIVAGNPARVVKHLPKSDASEKPRFTRSSP